VDFPVSRGHYFSSPAIGIVVQVAVDWVFWFALMCIVYWLIRRREPKPEKLD
jgi:NADH:ubiquinone oxidoreductase subunit 3 (subunit A)